MTEDQIAARVARKLTVVRYGEFYVGQRVRHIADNDEGVIEKFLDHFSTPSALCSWRDAGKPMVSHLRNLRAIDE